jgi:hypothetical protein
VSPPSTLQLSAALQHYPYSVAGVLTNVHAEAVAIGKDETAGSWRLLRSQLRIALGD